MKSKRVTTSILDQEHWKQPLSPMPEKLTPIQRLRAALLGIPMKDKHYEAEMARHEYWKTKVETKRYHNRAHHEDIRANDAFEASHPSGEGISQADRRDMRIASALWFFTLFFIIIPVLLAGIGYAIYQLITYPFYLIVAIPVALYIIYIWIAGDQKEVRGFRTRHRQ